MAITVVTPTFTNLELGLPGGLLNPDQAQSTITVQRQGVEAIHSTFHLPGVHGSFAHSFGLRSETILWQVTLRVIDNATLAIIEQSVVNALSVGEGIMTDSLGETLDRVILEKHTPGQGIGGRGFDLIQSGTLAGWLIRTDRLQFRRLAV